MMCDFDELDWIVKHNNVDFEPYKKLQERVDEVYLEMKSSRKNLDEEMSEFSEKRLLATFMTGLVKTSVEGEKRPRK